MDPGATIGNDVFVFAENFGNDSITGFGATPSATVGQDLLDIRALGITAATFNANVLRVAQANSTVITITGANGLVGGQITVVGVAPAALTAADFILAP